MYLFFVIFIAAVPFILALVSFKISYSAGKIKSLIRVLATILAIGEAVLFGMIAIAMLVQMALSLGLAFLTVVVINVIAVIFMIKSKKITN